MIKIGNNSSEFSSCTCKPETKEELQEIIEDRISKDGPECDLNDIDISKITDMSWLFAYSEFNGDISEWDTSNVTNMTGMFCNSYFDDDISEWNVNNVKSMVEMFRESNFTGDISNWKIKDNCDTRTMFAWCRIKEEFKPKALRNDQDRKKHIKLLDLFLPTKN